MTPSAGTEAEEALRSHRGLVVAVAIAGAAVLVVTVPQQKSLMYLHELRGRDRIPRARVAQCQGLRGTPHLLLEGQAKTIQGLPLRPLAPVERRPLSTMKICLLTGES